MLFDLSIRRIILSSSRGIADLDVTKDKYLEDSDLEKASEKHEIEYAPTASVDEVVDELEECAVASLSHCHHNHVRGGSSFVSGPSSARHISDYPSAPDDTTVVATEAQPSLACSPTHTGVNPSRVSSPDPSVTQVECENGQNRPAQSRATNTRLAAIPESVGPSTTASPRSQSAIHRAVAFIRTVLSSLLTPQALSILVALLISLVKPLKALFVAVDNSPIPNAPDGQPPLAFIMDTCSFIGAASVPLGLICLGSALARMNIQLSQWRDLPQLLP